MVALDLPMEHERYSDDDAYHEEVPYDLKTNFTPFKRALNDDAAHLK